MDRNPFTRARKLLMRKKLFIGAFLLSVAAIVAGDYLFNRSGAQDAAKSEEKKSDGNLFDILKKDLEAKKDAPPTFPALPPILKETNAKAAVGSLDPPPKIDLQPLPPRSALPPIAQEVAKLKDCPWSLHVEMLDGQTIVTATVNKKHEFKIVCKTLDLQT